MHLDIPTTVTLTQEHTNIVVWSNVSMCIIEIKHCVPQFIGLNGGCLFLSHLVMFDFVTPWAVAHQAPLSMGFSRQEYWSGLPFPSPGDLPHPGIDLMSLISPGLTGEFFTTSTTQEAQMEDTKYLHCHFPKMFITRTFAGLLSAMSALQWTSSNKFLQLPYILFPTYQKFLSIPPLNRNINRSIILNIQDFRPMAISTKWTRRFQETLKS